MTRARRLVWPCLLLVAAMAFGSTNGAEASDAGWAWRAVSIPLEPSGPGHGMYGFTMAYDTSRQVLVIHGTPVNGYARWWEWDGAAWKSTYCVNGWSDTDLDGSSLMVYDQARHVMLSYVHRVMWAWNGVCAEPVSFTNVVTPRAMYGEAMAYDPPSGKTLFFGRDSQLAPYMWTWDGVSWAPFVDPDGKQPVFRHTPGLAFDPRRGELVLHGGMRRHPETDTWVWNGADWSRRSQVAAPSPAHSNNLLAFDERRGRMMLLGWTETDVTEPPALWERTKVSGAWTWVQRTPTGAIPGGGLKAMAFFPPLGDC